MVFSHILYFYKQYVKRGHVAYKNFIYNIKKYDKKATLVLLR